MDLAAIFANIGASALSNATLQAVFLVSVLDFVLGTLHAISKGNFNIKWLDAWVGDHLVKAVMVSFAIVFGVIAPAITIGDFSFSLIGVTAEAAAVAYVAKTAASALANLNFAAPDPPPASVAADA